MVYYLFKLKFHTPIHIGESEHARSLETAIDRICADTMFSALCSCCGEDEIKKLFNMCKDGNLLMSDTLPYKGEELFVPKPIVSSKQIDGSIIIDKKKFKKIKYIPLSIINQYLIFLEGAGNYDFENTETDFGTAYSVAKVAIDGLKDPMPYSVGLFEYCEDAGLYIIFKVKEEEIDFIKHKLIALGRSGLGGKITSGYGKFEIEDEIFLNEPFDDATQNLYTLLEQKEGKQMLLTSALPNIQELESVLTGASYNLVRRGGFAKSTKLGSVAIKKQTQYFFKAGSVFTQTFTGDVYNVVQGGDHPVYRYSKPLFLGVNL
ncbi:MAG: type III-A CRISPR-associated RAMP protein Csm4 [Anaerovoracaceae bacterium]